MATKTSSYVTTGVTLSAGAMSVLIGWALDGFPRPIPADVPVILAALTIGLLHGFANFCAWAIALWAAKYNLPLPPLPTDEAATSPLSTTQESQP